MTTESSQEKLLQVTVSRIYELAPAGIIGHSLAVIFVTSGLWSYVDRLPLSLWALVQMVVLGLRGLLVYRYRHSRGHQEADVVSRWLSWYILGSTLTGAFWGLSILLIQESTSVYGFFLGCALFAIAGAGVVTLASSFKTYLWFLFPLLMPFIIWLFLQPGIYTALAFLSLIFFAFMIVAAKNHSRNFLETHVQAARLEETQLEILNRLGMAIEFRDGETGTHITRIGKSSALLARAMGFSEEHCQTILYASPMHDIGKIGIPDDVLLKRGSLSEEEWQVMRTHASIGERLLSGHDSDVMKMASIIAGSHHEKWDGTGYPHGLSGDAIPIEGQMTSICDVFDALTSRRPYKDAWSVEEALSYIQSKSGTQFSPQLVERFLSISDSIVALKQEYPDHVGHA